ncbi:MAG: cytochrome c3 family protein [Deltaproteobacteria bacterium]
MKKFVMALFVCAVASLVFFPAYLLAQQTPPESVTEEGSFGSVTFSHKVHSDPANAACKDCHHMGEAPVQKCESCHTADSKVNRKDAYHKKCIDCHKEKSKGPTGCMDCHKK